MDSTLTRKPAVAGQFYTGDAAQLRDEVEGYLRASKVEAQPERVACIVAPHAGYMFSGPTAGYAYARVAGDYVKRVILLGCSHKYRFEGASIFTDGAFETPLGDLTVDSTFARGLASQVGSYLLEPHIPEHSLEVQLPFIAVAMGSVPIVPILFGSSYGDWHREFASVLAGMAQEGDLLVVSTDLSHYLSQAEANERDRHSLDTLLAQDEAKALAEVDGGRWSMCGTTAVLAAIPYSLARGAQDWSVLDYRTSGDASGDTARVVGYAAVSMERSA